MRIEDEGVEAILSFYLYGLLGLACLVVISPLIVIAVPILILLGPVGAEWWRGRKRSSRIGRLGRWWLGVASLLLFALPFLTAVWYVVDSDVGPPKESFWLIVIALAVLPFPSAACAYAWRQWPRNASVV